MADESWAQIRKIFDDALRRKPEERRKFVRQACGENTVLLSEVESLLASLDGADSFLETPAVAKVADVVAVETKKLQRGKRFNHYEIVEQIGAGGMGEVYLASDKKLDRQVAVKILNERFSRDESNLKRFVQEAKAASALNHPNILVIHEIGEANQAHYIVSEYVKGETLREILREKSSPKLSEILDIAIQIAGALAAAHEAHLAHRDIKPENVMIRPDGFVKVLDFGLAKLVEQKNKSVLDLEDSTVAQNQTAKGVILGTVSYMSPEQAKGERVDERTDIFSLGVLIYEMIAGRTPFAGDSMSETFANLINVEPQPLVRFSLNAPDELQRIVSKMLRKNRDERYQTMRDMLTDLKDLRENLSHDEKLEKSHSRGNGNATEILRATTGGANFQTNETQHSFSRQIKRHKLLAAIVSIVFLGSVIVLSYYFYAAKNAPVGGKKSIAVLPLQPINTANREVIYEVGIAESLILKLGSMKSFVVRPLSAMRKYAGVEQDPLAAGREQRVDYVLASNYQTAGGKIRVTSQLLNVENGQIEETYKTEKDASDVFAVQDAVGEEVGNVLATRFAVATNSPKAVRGTENEEAYRLYLEAMYLVEKENLTDAKRAMEIFDEALKIDPNYAKAWAGVARAHCFYAHAGGDSPDAQFAVAKPALERAFALNADLPEAHAVLGIIKTDYDWDFAEGEKQFRRAIELSPNSDIFYRWYANRLSWQGRSDEAIAMVKTAIDLNPNYIVPQIHYGWILYSARRYDDAIKQVERVAEMDSTLPTVYHIRWRCFDKKGDYARAYESFIKAQQLSGAKEDALKTYETLYASGGWQSVLHKFLETVKANNANGSAAYTIAALSALVGEREQSFHYLDEAVKNRSLEISNLKGDPSFDSLRDDPRFDELIRRVELK